MKIVDNSLFHITAIFVLLSFASCAKDEPTAPIPLPPPPSVTGAWSGFLIVSHDSIPFTMNLSQDRNSVSGTGVLGFDQYHFSITGENRYPNVKIAFEDPGYYPLNFAGQLTTPTQLTGSISTTGLNGIATFTKK